MGSLDARMPGTDHNHIITSQFIHTFFPLSFTHTKRLKYFLYGRVAGILAGQIAQGLQRIGQADTGSVQPKACLPGLHRFGNGIPCTGGGRQLAGTAQLRCSGVQLGCAQQFGHGIGQGLQTVSLFGAKGDDLFKIGLQGLGRVLRGIGQILFVQNCQRRAILAAVGNF